MERYSNPGIERGGQKDRRGFRRGAGTEDGHESSEYYPCYVYEVFSCKRLPSDSVLGQLMLMQLYSLSRQLDNSKYHLSCAALALAFCSFLPQQALGDVHSSHSLQSHTHQGGSQ